MKAVTSAAYSNTGPERREVRIEMRKKVENDTERFYDPYPAGGERRRGASRARSDRKLEGGVRGHRPGGAPCPMYEHRARRENVRGASRRAAWKRLYSGAGRQAPLHRMVGRGAGRGYAGRCRAAVHPFAAGKLAPRLRQPDDGARSRGRKGLPDTQSSSSGCSRTTCARSGFTKRRVSPSAAESSLRSAQRRKCTSERCKAVLRHAPVAAQPRFFGSQAAERQVAALPKCRKMVF